MSLVAESLGYWDLPKPEEKDVTKSVIKLK